MILYYFILGLYLAVATLFSYIIGIAPSCQLDPQTTIGAVVQYAVIFYVICAIPASLYFLRHKPLLQMSLIALGGLTSLILFYFMGHYTSMLYLAGMCILAHMFTKSNILS